MKTAEVTVSLHQFTEEAVLSARATSGLFMGKIPISYTITAGGHVEHAVASVVSAKDAGTYYKIELGDWVMKCGDQFFLFKKGVL